MVEKSSISEKKGTKADGDLQNYLQFQATRRRIYSERLLICFRTQELDLEKWTKAQNFYKSMFVLTPKSQGFPPPKLY